MFFSPFSPWSCSTGLSFCGIATKWSMFLLKHYLKSGSSGRCFQVLKMLTTFIGYGVSFLSPWYLHTGERVHGTRNATVSDLSNPSWQRVLLHYCRCYFVAGGISIMIPLFSSDAQPECDGMRRLSVLDARRKRMSDMVDSAESGGNDDGKKDKFEESEIAADDNL